MFKLLYELKNYNFILENYGAAELMPFL